jgi:isoleucyl-tRNA synthetase
MFDEVPRELDVPALEAAVMAFWAERNVEQRYLTRNDNSTQRFSFMDGPITANGPMGVHHAWGRTYKDLFQRYNTMLGKKQRYQNGFDCQGLWVEVTVERELGFTSKRDIEEYGIAEFVRACKANVFKWAELQTSQSQRLGYFMHWDDSYYTLSDNNNYTIWHFLKICQERGLLYRGTDVMPWCTRCGTGLSETEVAEGYQDLTHRAVYVRFPIRDRDGEYLLVWTTTPWTLTSNVAVAVKPELTYLRVRQGDHVYYLAEGATSALQGDYELLGTLQGADMLGWQYDGPFDHLPAEEGAQHVIIPWEDVTADEGTGLVHIAPGCGKEDFGLGKQFGLKVVAPLDSSGKYLQGFDWLTGRDVHDVADDIIEDLRGRGVLYRAHRYQHRYPTCWRCKTELVFRLVDEWFISMDPLRQPMAEVVRSIRWLPAFGLERELDWIRNMSDWMISKKRYWGLALPFWICPNDHLTVIGGRKELFDRALSGTDDFESPHRPWVDAVVIRCEECGELAHRVADVGNPWLDAGIVPYSTLKYDTDPDYWRDWFPADFITESFPGQFRNWFYSMLAMSTVLENTAPFKTVLGYATARDQSGREMHKSWGNLIAFDETADRAGADVMRWLFAAHPPESNLNFGWESLDEVKRRLLVLWNTYSFFVTYANVDGWSPDNKRPAFADRDMLDRWILARLNVVIGQVRTGFEAFDAAGPSRAIDSFIEDLSTWYVRRSRRRFWRTESDTDKAAAYATLYECLTTLARLMAPIIPFISESLYRNLAATQLRDAPESVHLTDFPVVDDEQIDGWLLGAMSAAQQVVALGRAARDAANLRVRQPLARLVVKAPTASGARAVESMAAIITEELNVKRLDVAGEGETFVEYTVRPNLPALGPRYGKLLPKIREALAALDAEQVVASVERGESIPLDVDGQQVELAPGDILPAVRQREGYAAVAGNGFVVALDTELTPELIDEGRAREIVRRLNDWRKAAGLSVDDRIAVRYDAAPALAPVFDRFGDYIRAETLTVDLAPGEVDGEGYRAETTIAGEPLTVGLRAVARGAAECIPRE